MRMKKTGTAIAAAALLTVAACGGGGGGSPTETQTVGEGGDAGSGQDPEAAGPAAEIEGAQEGGTLTVNSEVSPATLGEGEGVMIDDQQFVNVVSFWCSWAAA